MRPYCNLDEEDGEVDDPATPSTSAVKMKLPLKPVKSRGRPKGAGMTVIGFPKKRMRTGNPVPFKLLTIQEKEKSKLLIIPGIIQYIVLLYYITTYI